MSRARNIKPSFFQNENLATLPPYARLLFAGLWCLADRAGRLEDRPKRIKAELFPYERVDVDGLLNALAGGEEQFILRYEVGGVRYIQVLNFVKHQNPHINERASSIPAPELHSASTVQAQCKYDTSTVPLALIPDSGFLIPDSGSLIADTPPVSPAGETSPKGARKRKPKPPPADDGKAAYGENGNIRLTADEHQKLVDEFGQADADRFIHEADGWVQAKGKQRDYKDWRQMVTNWGRRERRNEPQAAGSGPGYGSKPFGSNLPPGYRDTSTKDYTEGL